MTAWTPTPAWGLDSGPDQDWRHLGACRDPQFDPDWWTGHWDQLRQAIWVCQRLCPVRAACGRWAADNRPLARYAVYGGIYWTSRSPASPVRPYTNQPAPAPPPGFEPAPPPPPPRPPAPPGQMQPCGTVAAEMRHRIRGEQPCQPCLDARRRYDRVRRARARRVAA